MKTENQNLNETINEINSHNDICYMVKWKLSTIFRDDRSPQKLRTMSLSCPENRWGYLCCVKGSGIKCVWATFIEGEDYKEQRAMYERAYGMRYELSKNRRLIESTKKKMHDERKLLRKQSIARHKLNREFYIPLPPSAYRNYKVDKFKEKIKELRSSTEKTKKELKSLEDSMDILNMRSSEHIQAKIEGNCKEMRSLDRKIDKIMDDIKVHESLL